MNSESSDRRLERIRISRPNDESLAKEEVELAAEWLEQARLTFNPVMFAKFRST